MLTTKTTKYPIKGRCQESLWNEAPSPGREAMIAIIDEESKLIRTLKAENEEEYDKLHFLKHPRRHRLLKYSKEQVIYKKIFSSIKDSVQNK
ncbi:MAG TPA: hypothetical protein VFJ51_14685 [Nitrososphaeraceae archaeon]|nr:hypothetical protein [Nitrososphaeraceae archaeon]